MEKWPFGRSLWAARRTLHVAAELDAPSLRLPVEPLGHSRTQ